jgi:Tol biopolymer transport system component
MKLKWFLFLLLFACLFSGCSNTDISERYTSLAVPTKTSTYPPPFPTEKMVFNATPTPAPSDLPGFLVFDAITPPNGDYQIFIEDLSTQEIQQLTFSAENISPVWSHDGEKIAYISYKAGTGNVFTMNPDGSNQTQVTFCPKIEGSSSVGPPSWSPGSKKIVFTGACTPQNEDAVYIVDVNTGDLSRITNEDGNFIFPSWSNHGDRIAYIHEDKTYRSHLMIMDIDGSNQIEIATDVSRVGWCPDDSCIIYQDGYGPGYHGKLMIYDVYNKVSSPLLSEFNTNNYEMLSSQSTDGSLIVFSTSYMLYAMDFESRQVYSLGLQAFSGSLKMTTEQTPAPISPPVSDLQISDECIFPPGTRIAYTEFDEDHNKHIFSKDLNTEKTIELTTTGNNMCPIWSPDGEHILYMNWSEENSYDIYIMSKDGSNKKAVVSSSAKEGLAEWSPDGKKIVFDSDQDGNAEIYVMDLETEKVEKLTKSTEYSAMPSWSFDGSRIAYQSSEGVAGRSQIFVINTDGTNNTQLTEYNVAFFDGDPVWCPNDACIYFIRYFGGTPKIAQLNLQNLSVAPLFESIFEKDEIETRISISSSGKYMVFVTTWMSYVLDFETNLVCPLEVNALDISIYP